MFCHDMRWSYTSIIVIVILLWLWISCTTFAGTFWAGRIINQYNETWRVRTCRASKHEPVEEVRVVALFSLALLDGTAEPSLPTVVVVDDDRAIVEVVCDVLEDEGIPTTSCPHGRRAQACIRHKRPKVVLLDVQMPDVDGIELFRQLRADPSTSTLPVIFFTANVHKLQQQLPDYQSRGATLLPKPFDMEQLIDAVTRMLAA
jgi:CheY-like chemotaxis protein